MKQIIFSLLLTAIAFSSPLFSSCSSDDDDTPAYITDAQLYGTWQYESEHFVSTYVFSSPRTVEMHSRSYSQYYGWQEQNFSGSFYTQRADEHLLGILYWEGSAVVNGPQKANYRPFEWLNDAHTKFSLDGIIYTKQ